MQFVLIPRGRLLSDRAFLADLRRVAKMTEPRALSISVYKKYGRFAVGTALRFGGWSKALKKAGLKRFRNSDVTAEHVLVDIITAGRKLQLNCMTQKQYRTVGMYSAYWIQRHFKTWAVAARAAGLTSPPRFEEKTIPQLFDNLERVWIALGRPPRSTDMASPPSQISRDPYCRCFGSWSKALLKFTLAKAQSAAPDTREAPKPQPPMHKTSRGVSATLRYRVLTADKFRCRVCGRSPAKDPAVELQVDHIKPWSHGGETVVENLQTLCQTCNSGKSNHPSPK